MTIKMILATDTNGGIGYENSLPWKVKEDLEYFKNLTSGTTVLMGNNTFKSLPFKEGLPCRDNLVLTNNDSLKGTCGSNYKYMDFDNLDIEYIEKFKDNPSEDLFIIGGKSLYNDFYFYADVIHHTVIDGEFLCDTFVKTPWVLSSRYHLSETKILSELATVYIYKKVY